MEETEDSGNPGRKPCRCRTTVYEIKKAMDNGEGGNSRACNSRMTVVGRDSLRDAKQPEL